MAEVGPDRRRQLHRLPRRVERLVGQLVAGSVVLTRYSGALLLVVFTIFSLETCPAVATVVVVEVVTRGIVQAWLHGALINVKLTVRSGEAGAVAVAGVAVDAVAAEPAVEAGRRGAVINVDLAVEAGVARHAVARVVVGAINAGCSVHTRLRQALVDIVLAVCP